VPELLIGCGSRRDKVVQIDSDPAWHDLTTLDIEPTHHPDVVHDLNDLPLPFLDNHFAEVHAYEVLEHLGTQGDYRTFFAQFEELWRIIRPGGYLCGSSPALTSPWLWGDPGHTRVISPESFVFLSQAQYDRQIGVTPMSDYRSCYKGDFELVFTDYIGDGHTFLFALRAIK
jgi:hypothetical protein